MLSCLNDTLVNEICSTHQSKISGSVRLPLGLGVMMQCEGFMGKVNRVREQRQQQHKQEAGPASVQERSEGNG